MYGIAPHAYEQDGKIFDKDGFQIGGENPPAKSRPEPLEVEKEVEAPRVIETQVEKEEPENKIPKEDDMTRNGLMSELDRMGIKFNKLERKSQLYERYVDAMEGKNIV